MADEHKLKVNPEAGLHTSERVPISDPGKDVEQGMGSDTKIYNTEDRQKVQGGGQVSESPQTPQAVGLAIGAGATTAFFTAAPLNELAVTLCPNRIAHQKPNVYIMCAQCKPIHELIVTIIKSTREDCAKAADAIAEFQRGVTTKKVVDQVAYAIRRREIRGVKGDD